MTTNNLKNMTLEELVDRFIALGVAQDKASQEFDTEAFTPLYWSMDAVNKELRRRGLEGRRALLPLFTHENPQVRLQAARFGYGVAPEAARQCLQAIFDSKMPPQYLDAGMSLAALDNGTSMLD